MGEGAGGGGCCWRQRLRARARVLCTAARAVVPCYFVLQHMLIYHIIVCSSKCGGTRSRVTCQVARSQPPAPGPADVTIHNVTIQDHGLAPYNSCHCQIVLSCHLFVPRPESARGPRHALVPLRLTNILPSLLHSILSRARPRAIILTTRIILTASYLALIATDYPFPLRAAASPCPGGPACPRSRPGRGGPGRRPPRAARAAPAGPWAPGRPAPPSRPAAGRSAKTRRYVMMALHAVCG